MISVDTEKCSGCGACVRDCPAEILKQENGGAPHVPSELERFCLNCQHCLAVCPRAALVCNGAAPGSCAPAGMLPESGTMLNLLRQRRSVRQYETEALDRETLDRLKASLAWAPTGCNARGLAFTIVENREEMEFFRAETTRMLKFLIRTGIMGLLHPAFKRYFPGIMAGKDVVFRGAPHLIVCAARKNAPCAEADPWIALSCFDLFAQSLGVGTCWCGFAVHAFKWNGTLRKALNMPKGFRIVSAMLFGKPLVGYPRATAPEQFPISVR